jgi:hypothetical protein
MPQRNFAGNIGNAPVQFNQPYLAEKPPAGSKVDLPASVPRTFHQGCFLTQRESLVRFTGWPVPTLANERTLLSESLWVFQREQKYLVRKQGPSAEDSPALAWLQHIAPRSAGPG